MDTIMHFIFNWTTYFWSIPVWTIILVILTKVTAKEVMVEDLAQCIGISFLNPLLYFGAMIVIAVGPILFIILYIQEYWWDKYKNKKLF